MPGIVGLISSMPRQQAEARLLRMIECLRHEDFYETGAWIDESLGVYVGWVARKGSFSAGMPLQNGRGSVALVFAGEEFSEACAEHAKKQTQNPAVLAPSYLTRLYETDPSFPAGLNGRFHGLIADRDRGLAMLFNDRYGINRLYYCESNEAFYFAAEAKAILPVCPDSIDLDPRSLGEFISCGAVLENRSLFRGINILPGASAWVFRNGVPENKGSYFHPREWEDQEKLDPEFYYREFRNTFSQSIPRYFNGDERIAMSLTGGLDTRIIMAWQRFQPGEFPCYTFGGMFRDCQDVILSRQIAKMCGQPHEVIAAGSEFLDRFSHYAERAVYLTDGCVEVNRAPDVYLNEKARRIAPVRMTGNYGGELLRQVRTFKPERPLPGLFQPEVLGYVDQAANTYAAQLRCHPVSFAVFKQIPWNHHGILALEESQLSLRSPFLDNDLVRVVFRAPDSALASNEPSLRLIADGNRNLLTIPTDRGLAGRHRPLFGPIHRTFLEFLFKAEYGYDMGMPQAVARVDHALAAFHLERLFLGRHKVFHFRIWYRDRLAGYLREMLLDSRSLSRSYIQRRRVEEIVQGHLSGGRNYTNEIHKLLTLELIHRLFLDNPERGGSSKRTRSSVAAAAY